MGDVFLEYMVKKKATPLTIVLKCLIFLAGGIVFVVALLFVGSPLIGSFSLLIGVGGLYGAWVLASAQNVEYEYIYTNGEIDFDKIIAKRRRKRMITVRISSFDEFDKYDPQKNPLSKFEVKYDASVSHTEPDTYYVTFHNKEGKSCILLFNPGERLLETINAVYRRRIRT